MKKGLGRGFDSLIPTTLIDETFDPTAAQDGKLSKLQELPIDDIQADPKQPRRLFDEGALAELAASIREHGVLQPIVVSPQGKKYVVEALIQYGTVITPLEEGSDFHWYFFGNEKSCD